MCLYGRVLCGSMSGGRPCGKFLETYTVFKCSQPGTEHCDGSTRYSKAPEHDMYTGFCQKCTNAMYNIFDDKEDVAAAGSTSKQKGSKSSR